MIHTQETCSRSMGAVKDALYALSGKWKLPLILALQNGPRRFKDIQRELVDITPKILSKELKELELNEFIERKVFATTPVSITYELTPYSSTLNDVIEALRDWGEKHKRYINAKYKQRNKVLAADKT